MHLKGLFLICRAYLQLSAAEGHIAPMLQPSISHCIGDRTESFPSSFWSHPPYHWDSLMGEQPLHQIGYEHIESITSKK